MAVSERDTKLEVSAKTSVLLNNTQSGNCLFFKLSLFAQTPTRTCQSKFGHELI